MSFSEDLQSGINSQPEAILAGEGFNDTSRRIRWIQQLYLRYLTYWRPDMERAIRNARMYWHIDYGQWPREVVDKLRLEGRRPPTMPVIPDKIETLVGSVLANGFDVCYESPSPQYDQTAMALQDMYYSDSQNFGWDMAETECMLDSCIYAGFERMIVNTRYSPYGNIDFESVNPRHVLLDPTWKTNNINDLDNYIVFNDLTATQIIEIFPNMKDELKAQFARENTQGVDYGINQGAVPDTRDFEKKWGSYHRVIEFHSLVRKTGYWEWDKKNGCYFPETGYPSQSTQDQQAKFAYIQKQGLGVDDIAMVPRRWAEKHIETCVPTLLNQTFLTRGLDPVQCGNINLFPLGIRYNGQFQGVVADRLYDLQLAINRAEMNIQDIMMRSAKGAFILDRALTGGNDQVERDIESQWNDPAARIWVDEGSTKNLGPMGGVIPLPVSNVPFDQANTVNRYYDNADRYSKVNAAMDSRQESAKESGKLFEYKFQAGQMAQRHLMKLVEQHKKDKANAYYEQARMLYADGERTFTGTQSGKPIIINTTNSDMFDLQSIPRLKISVIPSPTGVSVRADQKNEIGQALSLLVDPNDRLVKVVLLSRIFGLSDMTDSDREELDKAFDLAKMDAAQQLLLRVKQSQQMLEQLSAPPAPMAPPPVIGGPSGGQSGPAVGMITHLPAPPQTGGELYPAQPPHTSGQ